MNAIRFVPTWLHGIVDYIGGIGLIALPFVFGFSNMGGIPVILPIVLGIGLILYSLFTNYERGIPGLKFIPMSVHLIFDFIASALLAVAPFVFGFANQTANVWVPDVVLGIVVILLVLVSQTHVQTKTQAVA
jgi:hypothetical protein